MIICGCDYLRSNQEWYSVVTGKQKARSTSIPEKGNAHYRKKNKLKNSPLLLFLFSDTTERKKGQTWKRCTQCSEFSIKTKNTEELWYRQPRYTLYTSLLLEFLSDDIILTTVESKNSIEERRNYMTTVSLIYNISV